MYALPTFLQALFLVDVPYLGPRVLYLSLRERFFRGGHFKALICTASCQARGSFVFCPEKSGKVFDPLYHPDKKYFLSHTGLSALCLLFLWGCLL